MFAVNIVYYNFIFSGTAAEAGILIYVSTSSTLIPSPTPPLPCSSCSYVHITTNNGSNNTQQH